jgi:hypothetical protein
VRSTEQGEGEKGTKRAEEHTTRRGILYFLLIKVFNISNVVPQGLKRTNEEREEGEKG